MPVVEASDGTGLYAERHGPDGELKGFPVVFSCAYAWAGIHYLLARRHFKKDMISL